MYVVLISGTSNTHGRTSQAIDALLEGVQLGGGEGELIRLPSLRIERCRHCEEGAQPCLTTGRCTVQDDFGWILERIRRAGAVVFASPVYLIGVAPSLRAFLHRLGRVCRNQETREGLAGIRAVTACIGGGAAHCVKELGAFLTSCGFDVQDEIVANRMDLSLKLAGFRAAGQRLACSA